MDNKSSNNEIIVCSFCDSSQNKLDFLVEGNNAFICNICIDKAKEALEINNQNKSVLSNEKLLKPKKLP